MGFESVLPIDAPRSLVEQTIVAWRDQRERRLALDKVAAAALKEETELKEWLIAVFRGQKFEGMVIGGRITGVSPKEVQVVEDREAFINFIYENKAIDLLQFRASQSAIDERIAEGIEVPGTRVEEVYGLYDRKA